MGACGDAPVLLVNNKRMCCHDEPAALDGLVEELRAAAERGEGARVAEKQGEAAE